MASRATRQLFSSSLRSSRTTLRGSTWQSLGGRRGMSSTVEEAAKAAKKSSDLPWMIGSAVVFGPAFLYFASPSMRKDAPHKPHKSASHAPVVMKDDEGKEADVTDSMAKAEAEDAPKSDGATPEKTESKPKDDAAPTDAKAPAPEPAKVGNLGAKDGSESKKEGEQDPQKDKEKADKEATAEAKTGDKAKSGGTPTDKAATTTTKQDSSAGVDKAAEHLDKKQSEGSA